MNNNEIIGHRDSMPLAVTSGLVGALFISLIGISLYFLSTKPIRHKTHIVTYTNEHRFEPSQLNIGLGDQVKFINKTSDRILTVTADSASLARFGDFHSEPLISGVGASWIYRFERRGEVRFYNEVNDDANGRIVIE